MSRFRSLIAPILSLIIISGCGSPTNLDLTEEDEGPDEYFAAAESPCGSPMSSKIKNGNFSADLTDWTVEIHDPPSATVSAILERKNKVARVRNSKEQLFYQVQFWQPVTSITRDHCYHVCFRGKGYKPRPIKVQLQKNAAPWTSYGLWYPENLTETWATYETEFWATETATDARLTLLFGDSAETAYVDDVTLIDRGDVEDCAIR